MSWHWTSVPVPADEGCSCQPVFKKNPRGSDYKCCHPVKLSPNCRIAKGNVRWKQSLGGFSPLNSWGENSCDMCVFISFYVWLFLCACLFSLYLCLFVFAFLFLSPLMCDDQWTVSFYPVYEVRRVATVCNVCHRLSVHVWVVWLDLCRCVFVFVCVCVALTITFFAKTSCLFVCVMCVFVYEMCSCVFVYEVVFNIAIFKVPLGRGSPLGGAHHLLCHSYCGQ